MARLLAAFLAAALLGLVPGGSVDARRRLRAAKSDDPGDGTTKVRVHEPEVDVEGTEGNEGNDGPSQSYAGVTLRGGEPPETKPPPSGLQVVTWPGFRADKSGSEVFLQLTGQVSYKQKVKGNRISVTLEKTIVQLRNNLRSVNTRNFRTPVASFRLRRAGKDSVRLDITLRRTVAPTVSLAQRGKYSFLVVAFPPPAAPQ